MKKQICFLLSLLLAFSLSGCAQPPEEAEEGHLSDVVTISDKALKNIDIQTLVVEEKAASGELNSIAEIRSDENRVFHINPPIAGRIIQDRVMLGDVVKQGQVVAVLQNVEVAKVNAEFIHQLHQNEIELRQAKTRLKLAESNLDREKRLLDEGISPRKDYLQAQADHEIANSEVSGLSEHSVHIQSEARALLGAYGATLSNSHSERISTSSSLTAPRSGIVINKNVVIGDMVNPEKTLYELADLSKVWLDITLYPKDIELVKLGQKVTFTSDALSGQTFVGVINYLQPMTVGTGQTFIGRVFLDNPGIFLKPGTLGQATIQTGIHTGQPFISDSAIQSYGKEKFVFLALGEGKYKKQTVELGSKVAGGYLVQAGVQSGDKIVGKGSFTLKAEILKNQFGGEE